MKTFILNSIFWGCYCDVALTFVKRHSFVCAIVGKTLFNVCWFWGPKSIGRFEPDFFNTQFLNSEKLQISLSGLRSSSSEAMKLENGALGFRV